MSFVQPFLRGRVLVKRVASVCGMIVVLPLMGCGSAESLFNFDSPRRDARLAPAVPHARPSRPVLASAGSTYAYAASGEAKAKNQLAATYATVPTSGSYQGGGVQRSSLAPLPESARPGAETAIAPASYAISAVQDGRGQGASRGSAEAQGAPVREAANSTRKQQQPYSRAQSDYDEADEARRTDYAPEPRARKGEPRRGGGEYVVQPGDTLYAIAQRHGLSLDELSAINGLKTDEIYVGQRLRVENGSQEPQGRGHRQARPEPRGLREAAPAREPSREAYRPPVEERGAPYRAQNEERRSPYQDVPTAAYIYEPRQQGGRYEEPEGYQQQPQPYRSPYAEERPAREQPQQPQQQRAYREPRGDDRPEYTSSNSRYTPDGPFEPSPDAPWRGETEWRRMKPQNERQQAYEPQPEPRYDGRRAATPEAYDARPPYQAYSVERAPYNGRVERERERETYAAPQRQAPSAGYAAYTVQRGDSLYEIARRNGVDQRDLAAFNGLSPDAKLIAGQDLRIPQGQGRGPEWSRPRSEGNGQPAPVRPRASTQPERAPVKATAAAPEQAKSQHQPQGRRPAKIITEQLPAPQRTPPAKPAVSGAVEEETPPAKAPQGYEQPQQRMAAAAPAGPAEQPRVEVAMSEPAPSASTAAATAPVAGDHDGPRECEALLASPEPRSAKTFRTPVQGMVINKFGAQSDGSFNDGINFSVPKGTPVKAAENGVVAYAGDELAGFGNLVLIRHSDGYVTAYAHNDELLVRKCDVVKRGQIISKAGASGKTSSPQLHFELRKDSKPMDPDGHFSGT